MSYPAIKFHGCYNVDKDDMSVDFIFSEQEIRNNSKNYLDKTENRYFKPKEEVIKEAKDKVSNFVVSFVIQ